LDHVVILHAPADIRENVVHMRPPKTKNERELSRVNERKTEKNEAMIFINLIFRKFP
jgi:hypothetical protein